MGRALTSEWIGVLGEVLILSGMTRYAIVVHNAEQIGASHLLGQTKSIRAMPRHDEIHLPPPAL